MRVSLPAISGLNPTPWVLMSDTAADCALADTLKISSAINCNKIITNIELNSADAFIDLRLAQK